MPEKKYRPLADELRPTELDDVVGQNHILGKGGLLRRIIESGDIPNMIFYGPSGTGKTTVARIIAEKTNRTLRKLNATTAGLADITRDHRRAGHHARAERHSSVSRRDPVLQ